MTSHDPPPQPPTTPSTRASPTERRYDNRGHQILRASVELFSTRGFDATSIRDIATLARVQPASVYYHYPSKDALLVAIVDQAAHMLTTRVTAAAQSDDPWQRLEAACAAHLDMLLHGEGHVRVLVGEIPSHRTGQLQEDLVRTRDSYEEIFRHLVDELPIAADVNRKYLRLTLLGAINWTLLWYRPGGDEPPTIARHLVGLVRNATA